MTTQKEHFAYELEATWGTYIAPTKAFACRRVALNGKQTYEFPDETGGGRAQAGVYRLERGVSGTIEASLRPENVASLFKTVLASVVSTQQGATTAYRHKMLADDTAEIGSFSGQIARANGVTEAFKGATPKVLRIQAEAKQVARFAMDFVAKDLAVVGGTWADGSAAPSAVTFDSLYAAAPRAEPLKFFEGSILLGGSKSLTSNEITVTGNTAKIGVRRCEVAIDLGTEEDDFNITTDPTIQSAQAVKRKITATLDIDQKQAVGTFRQNHLDGTDMILVLDFTGPIIATTYPWLFRTVLPILKVSDAPQADIDGGQGLKRVTVELTAYADASLTGSPDVNIIFQNKETTI
jgi:hypothetical protein